MSYKIVLPFLVASAASGQDLQRSDVTIETSQFEESLEPVSYGRGAEPQFERAADDTVVSNSTGEDSTLRLDDEKHKARLAPEESAEIEVISQAREKPALLDPIMGIQKFAVTDNFQLERNSEAVLDISLTNINQKHNRWFVLSLSRNSKTLHYHLENPNPKSQQVKLRKDGSLGLELISGNTKFSCLLGKKLAGLRSEKAAFVSACQDNLLIRNAVQGERSVKEKIVEMLRDNFEYGEEVTDLVKRTVYQDRYVSTAQVQRMNSGELTPVVFDQSSPQGKELIYPKSSNVLEQYKNHGLKPKDFGFLELTKNEAVLSGRWYSVKDGVFVSTVEPGQVRFDPSFGSDVELDSVESKALVYSVAFDLNKFAVGFALGTDHPRIGWSNRVRPEIKSDLPGPDGFEHKGPLVTTGKVPPYLKQKIVGTFTGGFKRSHGAFKWGKLASVNAGSHYGFMENGVIFSRLNPGLSTVAITGDGSIALSTWKEGDSSDNLLHARQNGVPLIDISSSGTNSSVFGEHVDSWGRGNWSGSSDRKLRTLRAGLCLQENENGRFLVYSYFSGATPRAMAKVFASYSCRYAMHLDMNALEHTYMALYEENDPSKVHHLVPGMSVLDHKKGNTLNRRFIELSDNRDFFYLYRK